MPDISSAEVKLLELSREGSTYRVESIGVARLPQGAVVDKTLAQLRLLRDQSGGQSRLVQSLVKRTQAKGIAGEWGARAARIVDGPLAAALDEQIALATEQRARASHDAGIRNRPAVRLTTRSACVTRPRRASRPTRRTRPGSRRWRRSRRRRTACCAPRVTQRAPSVRGWRRSRRNRAGCTRTPSRARAELLESLNAQVAAIGARLPEYF